MMTREEKMNIATKIQEYFSEQGWERIGNLEAEAFLDYMMKETGPYMYNEAVQDAQKLISERIQNIEEELYGLEKPIKK
ncbi:DUF2164 domain-containing protein [Ectobacillus antri]|jgi:uncharacterized protein (DUF2164 family)|uniref:DUF2164 domain-containing protein n=1 Tax=Ectobacillus antri TaxID=2486280 RepID=A0ABT6H4B5_9BACI|nr:MULTISPECIES: DUF2164 domain-containing protein [Ectobacillus]MDG4656991.1 DUF2164 domain-containing protein [Ectobacillus antri]MDG5754093.1 DUF2164 domain-containing protein [Ectobacillus antri]UOY93060.1 DUF2164 domain-containing protein [Ectobacillus sp. JY-23]